MGTVGVLYMQIQTAALHGPTSMNLCDLMTAILILEDLVDLSLLRWMGS